MAKKTTATRKLIGKKGKKGSQKSPPANSPTGAPFNEQDPKRRLGNFAGAGEHARQGGRTTGIVGQTKQRNRTDKSKKK